MDRKRVLFNAANLSVGGAVQVAVSVLAEWLQMGDAIPRDLEIWASTRVDWDLRQAGYDPEKLPGYRVLDVPGARGFFDGNFLFLRKYDRVLTLFGPLYSLVRPKYSVTGFAKPQIIYPDNEMFAGLSLLERLWRWVRSKFRLMLFRRSDRLVVELEHVAERLDSLGMFPSSRIDVVHNCINSVFLQPERWASVIVPDTGGRIRIGYLGRNYEHKNTAVIPEVKRILSERYGVHAEFFVTFTEEEWCVVAPEFRESVTNIGPLSVAQCPLFYASMDAILFPSLLECFSATPLEALVMGKTLFASDRPFVRDVCGDHAVYVDPLSPQDIAVKIHANLHQLVPAPEQVAAMRSHVLGFSSPRERAEKLLVALVGS